MDVKENFVEYVSSPTYGGRNKIKKETNIFDCEDEDMNSKVHKSINTMEHFESLHSEVVIKEGVSFIDENKVKTERSEVKSTSCEKESYPSPLEGLFIDDVSTKDQVKKEFSNVKGVRKYETNQSFYNNQELPAYNINVVGCFNEDSNINLCTIKNVKDIAENCNPKKEIQLKEKSENVKVLHTVDVNNYSSSRHVKLFRCKKCSYVTTMESWLTRHMELRKHDKNLPLFKCQECTYLTNRKLLLKYHQKMHHAQLYEKFECFRCLFKTIYKFALREHIKVVHLNNEVYICNECGSGLKRKYDLIIHMKRKHSISKNFKCSVCDFKTANKYTLTRHSKRVHRNEDETFTCTKCIYVTSWEPNLKLHLQRVHHYIGDGVFKCETCAYETSGERNLKCHLKIAHRNNQDLFKCSICDHKTRWKHHLVIHMKRKHTTGYMFKCDSCSYQGKVKHDLTLHVKRNHSENPTLFYCYHCEHKSKAKKDLKRHITRKH